MRIIAMPAALHEVFGEGQSLPALIGILLAGLFGTATFYVLGAEALAAAGFARSSAALLLAFDIAAGCAANFTRGTSDYYARRAAKRWLFIAVHLHVPALALLAGLPLPPAFASWALSVAAAALVNGRAGKADQTAAAGFILAIGASALFLIPMPDAQRFIALLFFVKLAYAFAVDHYRADDSASPGAAQSGGAPARAAPASASVSAESKARAAGAPSAANASGGAARALELRAFELRALGPADKREFIAVMADAFALDPSFAYFFGAQAPGGAAEAFLAFMFDMARIRGEALRGAFLDGRLEACSVVELPPRPSLGAALSFIALAARAMALPPRLPRGSFSRLQRYMAVARGSLPPGRWRYLTMLGVRAARRGQGLGGSLLDAAIAEAEADPLCAGLALDTENERNLKLYGGRGFALLARHELGGASVYCMARPRAGRSL